MVIPAFDATLLKGRLARLGEKQLLAFGAICCERLLPNYVAFQQDSGFGNVVPMRKGLDLVWAFLGGGAISSDEICEAVVACESVAPSSEESNSLFVTAAQDACFAVCSLLDFLQENNLDKIVQVAAYATDSVDLYVQEIEGITPNDPLLEDRILTHSLMQRELRQQDVDLQAVEKIQSVTHEFLSELKSLWKNDGRGNLGAP